MKRILAGFLLSATLLAAFPALGEPELRPSVTVATKTISIGDLFAGAGAQAQDVIAAAPAVGMHITFNADWLAAMAGEHQLSWSPRSPYDQVTVERASRAIGTDLIVAQLLREIAARQPVQDAELQLDNASIRLVVAADAPDAIAIDGLTIEAGSGRITAIVSAPAGAADAVHQRVTGRLVYRVDVPVLNRPLAPGAVIAAGDLDMVKTRRDRIADGVATDMAQLVGQAPRRALHAGEPVRLADIQIPILVHKGVLVTIVFELAGLQLTTQGKALEDGGKDASIRIENTKSSRVIDAAVVDADTVRVISPGTTAAANPITASR